MVLPPDVALHLPNNPDASVERDASGAITVRKPVPPTVMVTAGPYIPLSAEREREEQHVCLYFQSTGQQRVIVTGQSAFQASDDKDTFYRLPEPKPAELKTTNNSEQEQIQKLQAYHDICALWGTDTTDAPPWMLRADIDRVVDEIATAGFVDTYALHELRRDVLLPFSEPRPLGSNAKMGQVKVKIPRSVLLAGPPGTGKTELSRSLFHKIGMCVLWYGTGAEFSSKWVGETEQAIMAKFAACAALPNTPCVLVIDEIDTLTGSRSSTGEGHRIDWISLMLRLIGSADYPNLLVVGLTNRKSAMDEAFLRHGRFGLPIFFGALDAEARYSLFKTLLKDTGIIAHSNVLDKPWMTQATLGFTTAMVAELVDYCTKHTTSAKENESRQWVFLNNTVLHNGVEVVLRKRHSDSLQSQPPPLLSSQDELKGSTIRAPSSLITVIVPLLELPRSFAEPGLTETWCWWVRPKQRELVLSTPTGVVHVNESLQDKPRTGKFPFDALVLGYAQQMHKVDHLVVAAAATAAGNKKTNDFMTDQSNAIQQMEQECSYYTNERKCKVVVWLNLDVLLGWHRQDVVSETKGAQTSTQVSPALVTHGEHWTLSRQTQGQLVHSQLLQPLLQLIGRFQQHERVLIIVQTENAELYNRFAAEAGWILSVSTRAHMRFDAAALAGLHQPTMFALGDDRVAITSDANASWRTAFTTPSSLEADKAGYGCWIQVHRLHKESKMEVGLFYSETEQKYCTCHAGAALSLQSKSEAVFVAWQLWSGQVETHCGVRPFTAPIKVQTGDILGLILLSASTGTVMVWHNSTFLGYLTTGFPAMRVRWAVSLYHPNDHISAVFEPSPLSRNDLAQVQRPPSVQWSFADTTSGIRANGALSFVTTKSGWQTVATTTSLSQLRKYIVREGSDGLIRFVVKSTRKGLPVAPNVWIGLVRGHCFGHRLAVTQHLGQSSNFHSLGLHSLTHIVQHSGEQVCKDKMPTMDKSARDLFIRERLWFMKDNPAFPNWQAAPGVNHHQRQGAFTARNLERAKAQEAIAKAKPEEVKVIEEEISTQTTSDLVSFGLFRSDAKDCLSVRAFHSNGDNWHWGSLTIPKELQEEEWFPAISVYDEGLQVEIEPIPIPTVSVSWGHERGGCIIS